MNILIAVVENHSVTWPEAFLAAVVACALVFGFCVMATEKWPWGK